MFFMFYILVFTIYFCEINSSSSRAKYPDLTEFFKKNDAPKNKEQLFTIQNPVFHITKNRTSTPSNNLKLNVFDKMLSDEMFSIKQRFFEKDLAYTTTDQWKTKLNVATPTLEVKQKWPVVDQFTRSLILEDISEEDTMPSHEKKLQGNLNKHPKIKSLDVRSLSDHPENLMHSPAKKCNCANAKSNHQCKHGDDCTRPFPHGSTMISPPPMYLPYQAYFISDNNENLFQNTHYHPNVMNELKIPKSTRRRKPTTPTDEDLYYDDDKKKRKPHKDDREIIMNIDYDIEETKKPGYALSCVHEDLNEVFSNGVQRRCYCSLSQRIRSQYSIIFICLLMSFAEYFVLELLTKYKVIC